MWLEEEIVKSGFQRASLKVIYDAERDSPELFAALKQDIPDISDYMSSIRRGVPLAPTCAAGGSGSQFFYRFPNHYRSICCLLPVRKDAARGDIGGVVAFKGSEPLCQDFKDYLTWMLGTPFRSSALPLGLHFPLEMRLPPAAMWIEECIAEQAVATKLQLAYLKTFGRIARLPLPLFTLRFDESQVKQYETTVRSRLPEDAWSRIKKKVEDGLGVEVYYYPGSPVRVSDLFVGNVGRCMREEITPLRIEETANRWAQLAAEIMLLEYMPFAPWHRGMGSCLDSGNACIDGGFTDLLTLVPFNSIPGEIAFRRSFNGSVRFLSESFVGLCAAGCGLKSPGDGDAGELATELIGGRIKEHISRVGAWRSVNAALAQVAGNSQATDVCRIITQSHEFKTRKRQYGEEFGGGSLRIASPHYRNESGNAIAVQSERAW